MEPTTEITGQEGQWVMLEIFGHRCHWGFLTEVEKFGAKLARIDCYRPEEKEPAETHFYGGASIFSMTQVTEETARSRFNYSHPKPAIAHLPAPRENEMSEEEIFADDAARLEEDMQGAGI